MKFKFKDKNSIYDLVFIVITVLLIVVVMAQKLPFKDEYAFSKEGLRSIRTEFTDEKGNRADLSRLPYLPDENADGKKSLFFTVPADIKENDSIVFFASNVFFTVVARGSETPIYSSRPTVMPISGKSYGTDFNSFDLSTAYAGVTLRFDIENIYSDSGSFQDISLGSSGAFVSAYFHRNVLSFVIGLIIIVIGVLFFVFSWFTVRERGLRLSLRGFSVAAVLFGLWALVQNRIPLILFGNPDLWRLFEYPVLMLIPYHVILAINGLLRKPQQAVVDIAFYVCAVVFVLCTVLNFLGIDWHDTQAVTHVMLVASFILMVMMLVGDAVTARKEGKKPDKASSMLVINIGIGITFACVVIDLIRYYTNTLGYYDRAMFSRIGFLILELLIFYKFVVSIIDAMRTQAETETYKKLAFRDALTSIGNRTSYINEESALKERIKTEVFPIVCCSFDINDLKHANDTFGHAVGDIYIKTVAQILAEAFKDEGVIFRIGGDEFAGFITGVGAEDRAKKTIAKIEENIYLENLKNNIPVSVVIAYGWASVDFSDEQPIENAEVLADRAMYKMKNKIKKESQTESPAQ